MGDARVWGVISDISEISKHLNIFMTSLRQSTWLLGLKVVAMLSIIQQKPSLYSLYPCPFVFYIHINNPLPLGYCHTLKISDQSKSVVV